MNTNKAAYWIAVLALALGLSSEYQHGRFVTLHRVADRADLALCRISTCAGQALAAARVLTAREGSDNLMASMDAAEMARNQSELLREQAREKIEFLRGRVRDGVGDGIREQIRAQAEMRRAEIEQIRLQTRSQVRLAHMVNRRVRMVCPKTGARIAVNAGLNSVDVCADED
jgi:hypothetical protein